MRRAIRAGRFACHTNGVAPGFVQANLVVLPAAFAGDFRAFCDRNPAACPLLAVSEPGVPHLPGLAADLDLRTDLGSYRLFRNGAAVGEVADIRALWQPDFVAFALGCAWSAEDALIAAGVPLRHREAGSTPAIYVSDRDAVPAGPFRAKLMVTMRPFRAADAIRAILVTAGYPKAHGAPIHLGDPGLLGIADLDRPWGGGGYHRVEEDELPLFWACGVTPQLALEAARLPLAITHTPHFMLVTDLPTSALATLP